MIPIGMSLRKGPEQFSVRTVSLAPAGVPANWVLDCIIDDIDIAETKGINVVHEEVNRCIVFFDVFSFVAAYPASSEVLDIISHSVHTLCTYCILRTSEES